MNGVLQILDAIARDVSQENRDLVEKGQRAGHALMRILNSILDYTKLAQGAKQLNPTVVSLQEVCSTVIDLHMAAALAKGISFQSRLDLVPHSTHIKIDEVKLFEVINNLVSNAIKFTVTGVIELSVQVTHREDADLPSANLSVQVRDTGPGIPETQQGKVFDPFFQGDTATTNVAGGTGLGLAIVKELVDILGGTITLSSLEAVGTVVRVIVPVDITPLAENSIEDSGVAAFPARSPDRLSDFGHLGNQVIDLRPLSIRAGSLRGHVLLVEDNELNAMLAARVLELLGLQVSVANNGLVGFDTAAKSVQDVILMDCRMPVMDGFEATRRIRAFEKKSGRPPTPIIGLTANALDGDCQKCLDAGMSDYLGKPYTAKELHVLLARWLSRHAAENVMRSSRNTWTVNR